MQQYYNFFVCAGGATWYSNNNKWNLGTSKNLFSMTLTIGFSVVIQGLVLDFLLRAFDCKQSQHYCDHNVGSGHHLWCACNCYCSPVCNFYQI